MISIKKAMPRSRDINLKKAMKKLRTKPGLTHKQLVAEVGVKFPTITHWEGDRIKPPLPNIRHVKTLTKESQT